MGIVSPRLSGKTALLRTCRRRHSLDLLRVMLRGMLRRLVKDCFFQRLNFVLMFLSGVARCRLRGLW
ncbi:MAG: hypothetical protein QOF71_1480 [Candidatus Eremiobacteraeota bacterium]|jgi:hypothetical protein|nr:hypothetical protein [Candidatus Eremiobacteraeota bacterium]